MSKVWLITGASRGFGRIWAEAALERGDSVVATARRPETLEGLVERFGDRVLAMRLDVTDQAAVAVVVEAAIARFGRIDVAVNNAGYGLFGFVEEVTPEQAKDQLETNFFGALWVTRAVLPHMRSRQAGHIIQVSSIGGVNAFPGLGLYHASKWALEGMSQALAQEVAALGIHVTLVEPTGYSTDWGGASAVRAERSDGYADVRRATDEARARRISSPGDPEATAGVLLELVDMEQPPLRLFMGSGLLEMITAEYTSRLDTWRRHDGLAVRAHGQRTPA